MITNFASHFVLMIMSAVNKNCIMRMWTLSSLCLDPIIRNMAEHFASAICAWFMTILAQNVPLQKPAYEDQEKYGSQTFLMYLIFGTKINQ